MYEEVAVLDAHHDWQRMGPSQVEKVLRKRKDVAGLAGSGSSSTGDPPAAGTKLAERMRKVIRKKFKDARLKTSKGTS